MQLLIINGSPRLEKSTTDIYLNRLVKGYSKKKENTHSTLYLYRKKDFDSALLEFMKADYIFMGFPLYSDAIPSGAKKFFEELIKTQTDLKQKVPKIIYLMQSGRPEANHCRSAEKYLERLTSKRLGCVYKGLIIRGQSQRFEDNTESFKSKVLDLFETIGESYAQNDVLDKKLLQKLALPEKLPFFFPIIHHLFIKHRIGIVVGGMLKKNGTYTTRWHAPYYQ